MNTRLIAIAAAAAVLAAGALGASPASAASGNGAVKGHIRSVSGSAIAGATVVVTRVDGTILPKKTTTSKTGRFAVSLTAGEYRLIAIDPKDRYATSLLPTTFTVDPGTADRVNKRLSPGSSITGKVTTSSGKLLSGASVSLFGTNELGTKLPVEHGTTNSKGEFKLRGLTAGQYDVRYERDGYAPTYYDGGKGTPSVFGTGKPVTVATGAKHTGTSGSLQLAGKITGKAYVNGIKANDEYGVVTASLIYVPTGQVLTTTTLGFLGNPDFKFGGLPAGEYLVRFAPGAGAPIAGADLPITLTAGQARSGIAEQLTTNAPSDVLISREISPDPVTAGSGSPFTVSVHAYGYSHAAGATVTLSYDGTVKQTATLDANDATTFTVPSDFWVGKPGSTTPVTIDIAATAKTRAATTTIAPNIR